MDELQISGKRYISSRRLAREYGYTADYLGQLIRGGKVLGQKVGRAWYVDAASFDLYLGEERPVKADASVGSPTVTSGQVPLEQQVQVAPEPVQEVETIIETPAPVVAEEKVEEPIAVAPVAEAEEKQEEKKVVEEVQHIPLRVVAPEAPAGLRYYADNEPSLPEIRLNKSESRIAEPTHAAVAGKKEVFAAAHARRPSNLRVLALAGVGAAVFVFSALVSSAVSVNLSIQAGNAASTSYSISW